MVNVRNRSKNSKIDEIRLKSGEIIKIRWNWDFITVLMISAENINCRYYFLQAPAVQRLLAITRSFIFVSAAETHTHTQRTKSKSPNLILFSINSLWPHSSWLPLPLNQQRQHSPFSPLSTAHGFLFINNGSTLQSSDCSIFINSALLFSL